MKQQHLEWQFSRKTRTGTLVLMALLLILVTLWRIIPSLATPPPDPEAQRLMAAWASFQQHHIKELADDSSEKDFPGYRQQRHFSKKPDKEPQQQNAPRPVPFDPNTATEQELIAIGFSPRTAGTMIKYRSKGGKFRKKEDLQKLYTLSPEDYARIAPYVHIAGAARPEHIVVPEAQRRDDATIHPQQIELNTADENALLSLRGIGPVFSQRIIHFRDGLGGFVAVEQLREVYGFPDSTYRQLQSRISVDASKVKKLNINLVDEAVLERHPYIGRKLAAMIIRKRKAVINFDEIEQLKELPLINDEKYRKIAPYLSTH